MSVSISLENELEACFTQADRFQSILQLQGEVFRQVKSRKTLRFEYQQQGYFAKLHFGIGWREIFKDLLQGRAPIIGAHNEKQALLALSRCGVPTLELVGYGSRGVNPATLQSFVITKELSHKVSLEAVADSWHQDKISKKLKLALIKELARITGVMHAAGLNHRDYYLCHIWWDKIHLQQTNQVKLYVIDLHRAQLRKVVPMRWRLKDLAGLLFSSENCQLTQGDLLTFRNTYQQAAGLKLPDKGWRKVMNKAELLCRKHAK